jgi:hypothetical protein
MIVQLRLGPAESNVKPRRGRAHRTFRTQDAWVEEVLLGDVLETRLTGHRGAPRVVGGNTSYLSLQRGRQ